jgi:S-adenosylmethionine-dependent methyltransferase
VDHDGHGRYRPARGRPAATDPRTPEIPHRRSATIDGVSAPANPFDDAGTAENFAVGHYGNLRGQVRTTVVDRQLLAHLPDGPARIVDVGGGSGEQSVPFARRGHDVTVADPSETMLAHARDRIAAADDAVAANISLAAVGLDDVVAHFGAGTFDLVMCHGVLMYLSDPGPALAALVELTRPGGLVSIVATNRRSVALRAGLRGNWEETLAFFGQGEYPTRYLNGLGVDARADDPDDVAARLDAAGADTLAWYGVRLFTDAWTPDRATTDAPEDVLAAEWEAATRDPYRQMSRLFHLVARRR